MLKVGGPSKFWGVRTPWPSSGCAHGQWGQRHDRNWYSFVRNMSVPPCPNLALNPTHKLRNEIFQLIYRPRSKKPGSTLVAWLLPAMEEARNSSWHRHARRPAASDSICRWRGQQYVFIAFICESEQPNAAPYARFIMLIALPTTSFSHSTQLSIYHLSLVCALLFSCVPFVVFTCIGLHCLQGLSFDS